MKKVTDIVHMKALDPKKTFQNKIKNLNIDSVKVSLEQLAEVLEIFRRRFNYGLTDSILNAVQRGEIVPVYNERIADIPAVLTQWLTNHNGKIVSVVNFSNFKEIRPDKSDGSFIRSNLRLIFALLQGGLIMREGYLNYNVVTKNSALIKDSLTLYVKMFMKALDTLYSVRMNKRDADMARFIIAKFFLVNVLERGNSSSLNNIAKSVIKERNLESEAVDFERDLEGTYDDLNSLFYSLSTLPILKTLNMRDFTLKWQYLFGYPTLFGSEHYLYFLSTIIGNTEVGVRIIKSQFIQSLDRRSVSGAYKNLTRIIKK